MYNNNSLNFKISLELLPLPAWQTDQFFQVMHYAMRKEKEKKSMHF
jgi:hypothetical protein